MKTILIAAFAVMFALPAEAQYQQRLTYKQWVQIRSAHWEWMLEYYENLASIGRCITNKTVPPMTYEQQKAKAIQFTTEDMGPCPVVPPDPRPAWVHNIPKKTDSDRIVEAIEKNTRAVQQAEQQHRHRTGLNYSAIHGR